MRAQKESIWSPTYKHYTVNDGLAQSQVMCIMQDCRGYIWMGTKGGISKFNGVRFENFYYKDSIPYDEIEQIIEDSNRRIWIFTRTGCGFYDGIKWTKVSPAFINQVKLINDQLFGWNQRDTAINRVTVSGLVSIKKFTKEDITKNKTIKEKTKESFNFQITTEAKTRFYQYGDKLGLELLDSMQYDNHYYGFLASNDSLYLRRGRGSTYQIVLPESKNIDLKFIKPNMKLNREYLQYFRSEEREIMAISDQVFQISGDHSYYNLLLRTGSIINQIMIANDNTIWVATENGAYQVFPVLFKFIPEKYLPQPWSIVESDAGDIYIGCYSYGMKRIRNEIVSAFNVPIGLFTDKSQWPYFYFGASKDKKGNMYFDHSEYAIKLNPHGQWSSIQSFKNVDPRLNKLTMMNWYDSLQNKLLFGMEHGVTLLDIDSNKMETIFLGNTEKGHVLSITQDLLGNYWFGSRSLYRYKPVNKHIDCFNIANNKITFTKIWSLETDTNGGMWIGTHNEGLNYKFPDIDSFIRIAPNLIDKTIFNIKQVDSFIIAGGIQGLFLINLKEFYRSGRIQLKGYNHNNGFPGIEPNQNGSYLDSKGNYWILCSNGVVTTHKSNLEMNTYPAQIKIYKINTQLISYDTTTIIKLNRNENQLVFHFESIGFQRTTIPLYSWRLKGYSKTWSDWSEDEMAFFSNLPSGNYTFEVKSKHPGSTDEELNNKDTYTLTVNNSFYKEPHFYKYTLLGSLALGLLFLGLTRSLNINRRASRQAKVEAEKREQQMKYYQIQSLQAQLNPHFIGNLLSTLHGFVGLDRKEEALKHIESLALLMRRFLESSKASEEEESHRTNKVNSLDKEIELLTHYIELEEAIRNHSFDYSIDVDPLVTPQLSYIPPMMIQPFVENAIKHGLVPLTKENARRGLLKIKFEKVIQGILCSIDDNGIGFDESKLKDKKDQVRSYGTELVKERAALLKDFGFDIQINIHSTPRIGTKVTIQFSEKDV